MHFAPEHGHSPVGAQTLRNREEVVIEVTAACGQWNVARQSHNQLNCQWPHDTSNRTSDTVNMRQERRESDLAGTPGPVPACKLRLDAERCSVPWPEKKIAMPSFSHSQAKVT